MGGTEEESMRELPFEVHNKLAEGASQFEFILLSDIKSKNGKALLTQLL
jgi:hypothetical protein